MTVKTSLLQKLTSPNPFAIISSRMKDGSTNLMAVSWWTYVSNKPATIAVCVNKKSLTNELIQKNKEFGLNIVDVDLKEKAFQCGTCSGRNVNKAEKYKIKLMDSITIGTRLVRDSKVAMECRVINIVETFDHDIFISEIVEAQINPNKRQLYAFDGYTYLDCIDT